MIENEGWRPMSTAPKNTYVMLLVDSGYVGVKFDVIIAKLEPEYKNWWCTIGNDAITDSHTGAIHGWRHWNDADIKIPEEEYYFLMDGDMLAHGDEMQRDNKTWVEIDQADIASYSKVTGKPLYWKEGNLPVRRKKDGVPVENFYVKELNNVRHKFITTGKLK